MSRVIFSISAIRNLKRFKDLLAPKNPKAADRAVGTISKTIELLETYPLIGRVVDCMDGMDGTIRQISILFGSSGYVARYRYDKSSDLVEVMAIKYAREAGFKIED